METLGPFCLHWMVGPIRTHFLWQKGCMSELPVFIGFAFFLLPLASKYGGLKIRF